MNQTPAFGYVYDEHMLGHECGYDSTMSECPNRIRFIHQRLRQDGFLEHATRIPARKATDSELLLNHPQKLIDEIRQLENQDQCEEYCKNKQILWACEKTDEAARYAVGGTIELVKAAMEGRVHNGFAIVRPPGHHSYGRVSQGYCIFNNVAIAAKYAVDVLGLDRVAIVDFDYHAGNGTYYSVKDDKKIHLTSIHAHHNGAFWPFSKTFDYATNDPNALFIPLNGVMNTESDYVSVFHHLVLPMLRQFDPQLILISAGFDAGYYDIMMGFGQGVKAQGYGHMARLLSEICPGKTVAVLEGGYFPKNYTECASMMVRGLTNRSLPELILSNRISGGMTETILNNLHHHSKYYPELEQRLEKFKKAQDELGLEPFPQNQIIFLGHKFRKIYDEMASQKCVRTREWFPELTPEQVAMCKSKIEEYTKSYKFTDKFESPSEDFLVNQCIWDESARSDALLKALPFTNHLINEFNDFVEGRIDNLLICDQILYREAVKDGRVEEYEPISGFQPV